MTYVIDVVLCLVLILVGYIAATMQLRGEKKISIPKLNRTKLLYLAIAVAIAATTIVAFNQLYSLTILKQLRLLTLLMVLVPIAAVDSRTNTIPNRFLLFALALRVVFAVVDFILYGRFALTTMSDALLGALAIGFFFLILMFAFKGSVGMGDVKLFALMGLYQGLWGVINSVFFSLVASFFVSILLLVTKKKTRKDVIPFAPSILLGTFIGICLAGM